VRSTARDHNLNVKVDIMKHSLQSEIPKPNFRDHQSVLANDFTINLSRPYIVKGLMLAGQVGMLAGPSNMGKSSISACLAAHVAMGREVGEMRVRRSAVIYVAAEDAEGIIERAYPFMVDAPSDCAPFEVFDLALNLKDREETEDFADYATSFRLHWKCDRLLIVIDTLNLSIGDGDENSARDMGIVIGNAQRLAKITGAHVLIIHHVGTNDNGRPRGSSAMTANIDTLLTLQPAEGNGSDQVVFVVQKKQRRIPKGAPVAFRIVPFEVGCDEDGDLVSFPMAVPFAAGSSLAPAPAKLKNTDQKAVKGSDKTKEILRILAVLEIKRPGEWHSATTIRDLAGPPFRDARIRSSDALRKAVKRSIDSLLAEAAIEISEGGEYRLVATSADGGSMPALLHKSDDGGFAS